MHTRAQRPPMKLASLQIYLPRQNANRISPHLDRKLPRKKLELVIVIGFVWTWRRFEHRHCCLLKPRTNAALISDERNCDQNEHYDQNHALFVFREVENPEEAFHFFT